MSLFKRFKDVVRSNINDLLDNIEDPKKLRDQAILDLQATKKKAQNLLAAAIASLKAAKSQLEKYQDQANTNEDLNDFKSVIHKHVTQEEQQIDTLKRGIIAIDEKITELSQKAFKPNNTSTHQDSPEEQTDHLKDTSAFDTFDRMEDKIRTQEFELEALQELLNDSQETKPSGKNSPTLEEELDALRKKD